MLGIFRIKSEKKQESRKVSGVLEVPFTLRTFAYLEGTQIQVVDLREAQDNLDRNESPALT